MIQKKVTDFFALEGNYPDLDGEGAAARLSAAIRCKTINYFDHSRTDYTEFDKLHAHIKASYPNIMRVGTFERIGHHAVLITIPGSDASLRPCLYMSHQDVVPVVEGTEQDWTHPAFSGDIADGYIWAARLTSKSRSSACWRPRNICSPAASPLPARRISPSATTRRPST